MRSINFTEAELADIRILIQERVENLDFRLSEYLPEELESRAYIYLEDRLSRLFDLYNKITGMGKYDEPGR